MSISPTASTSMASLRKDVIVTCKCPFARSSLRMSRQISCTMASLASALRLCNTAHKTSYWGLRLHEAIPFHRGSRIPGNTQQRMAGLVAHMTYLMSAMR